MLTVKKICVYIYIDSGQRACDTQNSSSFKIELARSYKTPPDTVFFVSDVRIPHSWMTVGTASMIGFTSRPPPWPATRPRST